MSPTRTAPAVPGTDLEDADCELCGSAARLTLRESPPCAWRSCSKCGHVYLSPRPAPSAAAALCSDAWPEAIPEVEALERRARRGRRWIAETLRGAVPHGSRVLEIGSGHGFLLAALREAGLDAVGVEPCAAATRFAERWLGVRAVCALPEQFAASEGSFAAVAADRTLERVGDVRALLERVRRWLRPGGLLVARWLPALPGPADAPLRRRAFQARTLADALRAAGFPGVSVGVEPWWRRGRAGWVTAR